MKDQILFIMPSINRKSIDRAVDSLIKQTDNRWHLCIVYDRVKHPRIQETDNITCINLDHKLGEDRNSAGEVRNVAIKRFANEYKWIGFLDDDDTLNKNYVKLLFTKYRDHDLVVFRMFKKMRGRGIILPPGDTIEINQVGISFCYNTKYTTLFSPSKTEDFNFLERHIKTGCKYIIADEIGYYVDNARPGNARP